MNIARRGKIARLPLEIRQQLNDRLRNGEPGAQLVNWLNSLPEVQAAMQAEFDAKPIREQNLSQWRKGGYAQWLEMQEAVERAGPVAAEANKFAEAAGKPVTDVMTTWLSARYVIASKQWEDAHRDSPDHHARFLRMRALCRDFVALRRADHQAERLKLDRAKFEDCQMAAQDQALQVCIEETKRYPAIRETFRTAFKQLREQKQAAAAVAPLLLQVNPT